MGTAHSRAAAGLTSLVLPAYNPGPDAAEWTWQRVREFVRAAGGSWEAVFVCDGCTDGTAERLHALARRESDPIHVLSYPANRGKGYAVRCGLLAARGQWRLFTDVDLAYSFADVDRVAAALHAGAEVVVASREHPASEVILPAHLLGYALRRRLQSLAFGWLARRLLPLTQRDTQAGLKGMTAAAAERVLPHLRRDGFGFDCELLSACGRFGLPVVEVPVRVRHDSVQSSTNWRTTVRMVRELFQIRRDWRHGPPPRQAPAVRDPAAAA